MPTERRRHQLYEEVKEVLSVDSADELMAYLPPVGWADVATKSDLAMVRSEIDALRTEMRSEMSAMRHDLSSEMSTLRNELLSDMSPMRSDMSSMRSDLRSEFAVSVADLKADLQRWTITTLIAMTGLFGALVFAAVRLGQ